MTDPQKTTETRFDCDGPGFTESWQASCQAILHTLQSCGLIDPAAWASRLGAERAAQARDRRDAYFEALAVALEEIAVARGLVDPARLEERTEAWRRAYLNTPHGQPVLLAAGE